MSAESSRYLPSNVIQEPAPRRNFSKPIVCLEVRSNINLTTGHEESITYAPRAAS